MTVSTRSSRRPRAFAAGIVIALAASVALVASPAYAANQTLPLDPAAEVDGGDYTITLDPTERLEPIEGSDDTLKNGPSTVAVDKSCPEGYRKSSRTVIIYLDDGFIINAASARANANGAGYGLNGNPISLTGSYASAWSSSRTLFKTGDALMAITCDSVYTSASPNTGVPSTSKYFATKLHIDAEARTWKWTPETEAPKTETATTLASSAITQTGATLTATVAPSAATGTVQFKQAGTAIGSPVDVAGGTATYSVSGLTAGTTYAFTAEYSGDATYAASTGAVSVTTEAIPVQDSSDSSVGVAVPTATTPAPTGLKMSAKPGAVTLTGPTTRTAGEVWIATGELGTVTVNDDRQSAGTPWTLNGRISKLTSGSNEIAASNVGWKPAKVGDGNGTAGAEVAASVDGGLGSDKPLATGTGSATANVTTSVGATITLNTPADAPAGDYTATLTLTLI